MKFMKLNLRFHGEIAVPVTDVAPEAADMSVAELNATITDEAKAELVAKVKEELAGEYAKLGLSIKSFDVDVEVVEV